MVKCPKCLEETHLILTLKDGGKYVEYCSKCDREYELNDKRLIRFMCDIRRIGIG